MLLSGFEFPIGFCSITAPGHLSPGATNLLMFKVFCLSHPHPTTCHPQQDAEIKMFAQKKQELKPSHPWHVSGKSPGLSWELLPQPGPHFPGTGRVWSLTFVPFSAQSSHAGSSPSRESRERSQRSRERAFLCQPRQQTLPGSCYSSLHPGLEDFPDTAEPRGQGGSGTFFWDTKAFGNTTNSIQSIKNPVQS